MITAYSPPILESKANDLESPHSQTAAISTMVFFFLVIYLGILYRFF